MTKGINLKHVDNTGFLHEFMQEEIAKDPNAEQLYMETRAALMEKYEDVYYQVMKHQLEEGIEQGIEIGRQQGVALGEKRGIEIGERKGQVMICFKMNLPMEEIQKHTGLSVEEIEAFRKEME